MPDLPDVRVSNQAAWDCAAQTYERDVVSDTAFLKSGGVSLFPIERDALGDLSGCRQAIHLQCSHGLDTLSLLNLGATQTVGIDFSAAMLSLARRKSDALGVNAEWIQSDVLDLPTSLSGTADLVYTGKGALPWVLDLDRWASGVAGLLRPGGRLFLLEGHPLNWLWRRSAASHVLDIERPGYFDTSFRVNTDFPASAVERLSPPGEVPPQARERQWNLGQVVTAVSRAGLTVERLEELADHYWPQFPDIPQSEAALLPHSFILAARVAA